MGIFDFGFAFYVKHPPGAGWKCLETGKQCRKCQNVFLILLYVSCSKSDKQPNSTKITYDKIYFLVVLTEFAGVAVKASLLPATDLDQLHALLMPNPGPLVLRQSAKNTQSE